MSLFVSSHVSKLVGWFQTLSIKLFVRSLFHHAPFGTHMNKNPPWRHSRSNPHCRPEFLQDINLEAPFSFGVWTGLDPQLWIRHVGGDCLFAGKHYTNWGPPILRHPCLRNRSCCVISSYWTKLKVPSVRACFPRPLACCRPVAAWAWWKRFPWKSSMLRCLGLLHAVNCRTKLDSHLKFGRWQRILSDAQEILLVCGPGCLGDL